MSDDGKVVHMVDVRGGIPAPDLRAWARDWLEDEAFDPDKARSVVLIVEDRHGVPRVVSQCIHPMDGIRLVGLLQNVIHRLLHGKGLGL